MIAVSSAAAARTRPRGQPELPWPFLQLAQPGDPVEVLEALVVEVAGILGGNYLARVAG